MSVEIVRHGIRKDDAGNITGILIGVVYTDANGKSTYRDKVFLASDFSAKPTKLEVKDKFKQWLTDIDKKGTSVLQTMKEETQNKEITIIVLKQGEPSSLVGESVSEV